MEKKEILRLASELNDLSMEYQLAHVIFACNKLTENIVKDINNSKLADLTERARAARTDEDRTRIRREMDSLKNPYRIYVEYVNDMPEDGARVVRLPDSNQLVIALPRKLLDKTLCNGWYQDAEAVKKLRETVAHEIGHIILNIKELMQNDGTQGSKDFNGRASEADAGIFAAELIRLRKERNNKLRNDPVFRDVF